VKIVVSRTRENFHRILQISKFYYHDERKKSQMSKVKVVVIVDRKTLWTGYKPNY
jgi:hypothetical protein